MTVAQRRTVRNLSGQSSQPPANDRSRFCPDIEGLRAVAVVMVVAFHASVPFLPGGFVGVDVFFAISGYVITDQLLREVSRTGTLSLAAFYARRARRILPAASVVIVAVALAAALLETPLAIYRTAKDLIAASLYWSNWHFISQGADYLAQPSGASPVLHFWSLAVEVQFYLVWPLLMLLTVRWAQRHRLSLRWSVGCVLCAVTILSLVAGIVLTRADHHMAQLAIDLATQTRGWEFGIGGVVALCAPWLSSQSHRSAARAVGVILGWAGLVAIMVSLSVVKSHTPFAGSVRPVLATAAVIVGGLLAGTGVGTVGSLLSLRGVRYVGRLSFGWYLWHWPVLTFGEIVFGALPWRQRCILMLLALVLAVATRHVVEIPISRWTTVNSRVSSALSLGLLCIVITAAISLGVGSHAVRMVGAGGSAIIAQSVKTPVRHGCTSTLSEL